MNKILTHYVQRPLEVVDTTLREGQQSSLLHEHHKYLFTCADKEDLLRGLINYGVKSVELFAPIVSRQEREDFAALKAVRDSLVPQKGYTSLLAHVRCHPRDVESAIQAGADGLNFYIGTSMESRTFNHGRDLETLIREARVLLEDVRRNHPLLLLRFSGEDAFRTREADLFRVYDEIAPWVDRLGSPDTVGVATPCTVARRVQALRMRYPTVELEGHFHNDRGFALVNALEGVRSGMRYIDTTILGIGERSGITSLTALLFNLYVDQEYDKLEGYHLADSYSLNLLLANKFKMSVPRSEPVSRTNRTHMAGVHQNAVLRDAASYEAYPLNRFGVTESEIALGPLSGWHSIYYFLHQVHHYQINEAEAQRITAAFKERIYQMAPGETPEQVLIELSEHEFGLPPLALPATAPSHVV